MEHDLNVTLKMYKSAFSDKQIIEIKKKMHIDPIFTYSDSEIALKVCRNKLKTVAFIAGKKNPAIQKKFIRFSIENFIANISLYALSWPKLNFGCYLTFEIIFKALFQWKNE